MCSFQTHMPETSVQGLACSQDIDTTYLYMLVEICCFSDWHLNEHHIQGDVSPDFCCIDLFGG